MVAFEDETWVELLPTLWKCWYLQGKLLEVETPGINERANVFITLDFVSGKLIYSVHRRRRSREFRYHLRKLMKHAKRRRFKRAVLMIDNSPVHRSAESRRFLEENRRFLKVFNLPSYSPNLNEVEHINRQLKRGVCANVYHRSMKNLKKALRGYLKSFGWQNLGKMT
ncbi:MAG: IS630 family transposase [Candidatus Hodarchaeaceae archaeon]|nr:IS630 family transposase [Candidatus Hodarchaeaceae archaeon]